MNDGLTRRGLLGSAAAAGAVAAGASPAQAGRAPALDTDVVVVGAGLAGLAAARRVRRAGRGVVVLEARERVGGRTLNASIGAGEVVEVGGQWVGPTQDRLLALARELGVRTFPTYNRGENLYVAQGVRRRYAGAVPPDPTGLGDVARAIAALDAAARDVPRTAPWRAARAREYDGQTFETWKRDNAKTPGGRFLLDLALQSVWAAEPRDVSLLHVLFYIGTAGNERNPGSLNRLISVADGAQERRFVGGSQRISVALARELGRRRVRLGHPVRRIERRGRRVRVVADGLTVRARQVIVTGPPALTALIDFEPALPGPRAQLVQRFPQGSVIKCHAIYDRPFWREEGLTGQVTSDGDPVRITFDNSPPDGRPGVLLAFIEAEAARRWSQRSARARRAAVLGQLGDWFGPRAARPRRYLERDWSADPWTRGCYGGYTPPGVLLDYGPAIRRPVGRVHWAGAEMATIWNGYMDGAVRSGEEVAGRVLAAL